MNAGVVLCYAGVHRWETRDESDGRVVITYNWCSRPGCPRYPHESLVNIELVPGRAQDPGCTCRKGRWQPECPVHTPTALATSIVSAANPLPGGDA